MHPALLLRVIGCENSHIQYVQLLRHSVDHDLGHSRQIVDECSEETHRRQLQSKAKAFAGIAEFERDLIRERTGAGRQAAKQRGVKFGRPQKLNKEQQTLALRLLEEGKSVNEVAKTFKVHGVTIYRLAEKAVCFSYAF